MNFLSKDGVGGDAFDDKLEGSHESIGARLQLVSGDADICCNNDPYFRAKGNASSPISPVDMKRYKGYANRKDMVPGVANGQAGLHTFMHVCDRT